MVLEGFRVLGGSAKPSEIAKKRDHRRTMFAR